MHTDNVKYSLFYLSNATLVLNKLEYQLIKNIVAANYLKVHIESIFKYIWVRRDYNIFRKTIPYRNDPN